MDPSLYEKMNQAERREYARIQNAIKTAPANQKFLDQFEKLLREKYMPDVGQATAKGR